MYRDAGSKPPTQASRPEGRLAALGNASMEFVVSQVSEARPERPARSEVYGLSLSISMNADAITMIKASAKYTP
jgi:hypothetical protein